MAFRRVTASFETLGETETPRRCRCMTTSDDRARGVVRCYGPNGGNILPGQRHYVVREKYGGKVQARYCDIACYDEYKMAIYDRPEK